MTNATRSMLFALFAGYILVACGGGETTRVESETHTTTIGQELLDLERAYRRGVISEREYEQTKEDIIRRYED